MDTVFEHIRKRLLERVGVPSSEVQTNLSIEQIMDQQINWDFFGKMAQAMVMGFFRYKPRIEQTERFNYLEKARAKLDLYEKTRNQEALVDAGNYLMMEYDRPFLNGVFYKSVDDADHAIPVDASRKVTQGTPAYFREVRNAVTKLSEDPPLTRGLPFTIKGINDDKKSRR